MLNEHNSDQLHSAFSHAKPFPHIVINNFLKSDLLSKIISELPKFDPELGRGKSTVNQKRKIQVSNPDHFTPTLGQLNDFLASKEFLADLSHITGIKNLLADEKLVGGGLHVTGPGGRLDVHLDFNYMEKRKLHRRINLLLYLNPKWEKDWGGNLQLWNQDVSKCELELLPDSNKCVIFETNDISYHGVTPLSPTAGAFRYSFATYYYTIEAPAHWDGQINDTLFKARPEEWGRKLFLIPMVAAKKKFKQSTQSAMKALKAFLR